MSSVAATPSSNSDRPVSEIRALTGLRGVAAFDVMLGHYNVHNNPTLQLFIFHDAAVDIFFALSAFTLCLVYGAGHARALAGKRYAVARFARIYPLYCVVTTIALVRLVRPGLASVFGSASHAAIAGRLLAQFALLAALPIPAISGFFVVPAWSVSVEALCYAVVFPPLFAASAWLSRDGRRTTRAALGLSILASAASLLAYRLHYNPTVNSFGAPLVADRWAYWVAVIRGGTMFTAGWAIFTAWRSDPEFRISVGRATDALAILFVLIVAGEQAGVVARQAVVVIAPFLIAGLTDPRSITARLLASAPLHFLGMISYSMYLLHLLVFQELSQHAQWLVPHPRDFTIAAVMLTIFAATVSYYLCETPARTLIRRWCGERPRSAAAPLS